ncbi:hypothetical protein HYV50_00930 [Candidatus Pacearchaeota archaeon]|nr:hypothetical protein [Candidatus Pacearchaeota archaeon]
MQKRGLSFFIVIIILLSSFVVYAQEEDNSNSLNDGSEEPEIIEDDSAENNEETSLEELEKEFSDEELEISPGISPDSSFYFIDEFFNRFGSSIGNREEKIAETKAMIQSGKIEEAREALEGYKKYADKLEKEVSPEERKEARKSAAAIHRALKEIESEIPEDEREEFIDDIRKKENAILTAAEIANKIKELCQTLSKLDPTEFYRVCKSEDNSPRWHKDLFNDLTEEQEKEARLFFEIMMQCFETGGKECRCEEIPHKAFSNECSVVAPLTAACEEGEETACAQMEEQTEDIENLLEDAPHLQRVLEEIEERFSEAQFDNHVPPECRRENAKTAKECMLVMFRAHAPEECIEALESGEIDFTNEREARMACEEIMFKENAPEECIEAGIKNPKECGVYMFKLNAPEECIEAGLTGEHQSDHRKCETIMREKGGPAGRGPPALGIRCKSIEDPEERLKCYDSALEGTGSLPFGHGFPPECEEKGAATPEECERVMREIRESDFERRDENFDREGPSGNWPEQCQRANAFTEESCRKVMEEGQQQREEFNEPTQPTENPSPSETTESTTTTETQRTEESSAETSTSSESSGSVTGTGGAITITSGVIRENRFLKYYFRLFRY